MLSERYITDRFLPDKAIDLIDEACSDMNLHDKNIYRRMELQRGARTTIEQRARACCEEKAGATEDADYAAASRSCAVSELQTQTRARGALTLRATPELTMDNLARVIELWTKIPASKIREAGVSSA